MKFLFLGEKILFYFDINFFWLQMDNLNFKDNQGNITSQK